MIYLAILSALAGCAASISGKYAFNHELSIEISSRICNAINTIIEQFTAVTINNTNVNTDSTNIGSSSCSLNLLLPIRILLLLLTLLLNSIMLNSLLLSMQSIGSVSTVTINNAVTFISSGIIGYYLFKENINLQWIIGITIVLVGVYIIQIAQSQHISVSINTVTNNIIANTNINSTEIQQSTIADNNNPTNLRRSSRKRIN